jgi:heptosyltransferase-1
MPAITDAAARAPGRRLAWVVEEAFAPLARLHPAVAEVIPVATRRWRSQLTKVATWREIAAFRTALRAQTFDRVIDTQGLLRSALIARLARGERHGYDAASIREKLASRLYDVTHCVSKDLHAVTRNRLLTAAALGTQPDSAIDYGLRPQPRSDAPPYAVLLHGTSRPAKEWREQDWIGIGQALRTRGLDVVLPWGTEEERLRSERLSRGIAGSKILPRQALDKTAQVIGNAALVVGVDTGLLHLAAAYRVPLLAIFLATDPGLTGPVGSGPIEVLGGQGQIPALADAIAAADKLLNPSTTP